NQGPRESRALQSTEVFAMLEVRARHARKVESTPAGARDIQGCEARQHPNSTSRPKHLLGHRGDGVEDLNEAFAVEGIPGTAGDDVLIAHRWPEAGSVEDITFDNP